VLLGTTVESVGFANDPVARRMEAAPRESRPATPPAITGNVYDLESWRESLRRNRESRGGTDEDA
jgi:hypothetical protein